MLLQENFESGSTTMTPYVDEGCALDVVTDGLEGSYALRAHAVQVIDTAWSETYLRGAIPPSETIYVQCDLRVDNIVRGTSPEGTPYSFSQIDGLLTLGRNALFFGVTDELNLLIRYFDEVLGWIYVVSTTKIQLGVPFQVKAELTIGTTGGFKVSVDGVEVPEFTLTVDNLSRGPSSTVNMGIHGGNHLESATVFADSLIVSDTPLPSVYHTLSIDTSPVQGITFNIGGVEKTTPYSESLGEGSYTVYMPPQVTVGVDIYNFTGWSDGNPFNPRTIDLLVDASLLANYELYISPEYVLSVSSTPISGIPFTLRGGVIGEMSLVTPWSGSLEEGVYEVEMPSNVIVDTNLWNFVSWNGNTNPIQTVNLYDDDTILPMANYQLQAITGIEVHAFLDSVEVVADGLIVGTGYAFQTPAIIELPAGSYTVELTYQGIKKTYTREVIQDQTIRLDGQMAAPPEPPIAIPLLLLVGGVVLLSLSKKK